MGMDRFIKWGKPAQWGTATPERLAAIARDFLGPQWRVSINPLAKSASSLVCETDVMKTWPLVSEYVPSQDHDGPPTIEEQERFKRSWGAQSRGFEVYFPGGYGETKERTSVITRQADDYTSALADAYTTIIARWFQGKVSWPS